MECNRGPMATKRPIEKSRRNSKERGKFLVYLENYWRMNDGEGEWDPDSQLVIEPMLRSVKGGLDQCIEALRSHEDDDAQAFIRAWDHCTERQKSVLRVEDIAAAAGVSSIRLMEVTQTALYLYGSRQTQMMLAAGLPSIVAMSLKKAAQPSGYADREWMLKAAKILPVPKGSQTAIQINTSDAEPVKEIETRQEWKYPEERMKDILSVLNPAQLEQTSRGEVIHFDKNRPNIFET